MITQNAQLTAAELREADELEKEFNRLAFHAIALKHHALRERLKILVPPTRTIRATRITRH